MDTEFKDEPRTGLLLCLDTAGRPSALRMSASMTDEEEGVLSIRPASGPGTND